MSLETPFTIEKPWGVERQFTTGENVTVKTIKINKGESMSLQRHQRRSEFWKILSGNPEIIIGEETIQGKEGDEFEVKVGTKHRISAYIDNVEFLEISHGDFDEEDVERIEDKYGRT